MASDISKALKERKYLQFILLIIIFLLMYMFIPQSENNILWRLPPLFKDVPSIINNAVNYVMFDWWPIDVYDPDIEEFEEKPLFGQFTRSVSGVISEVSKIGNKGIE